MAVTFPRPGTEALPVRTRGCCEAVPDALPQDRAEAAARLFRALADPTRVQMVHMLKGATEPICVCDFTAAFDLGQPTVSHHLGKLREAGLVRTSKRGIWSFYQLRADLEPAAAAAVQAI